MCDFFSYYDQVGARPNSMVVDTVRRYTQARSAALDLGSGNFRDSRWLKKQGFERVVAVDPGEVEGFLHDGIEFHQVRIEDFHIQANNFDFIAACSVFHYIHVDDTVELIPRIMRGLRPGGVFAFNALGERDGWVMSGADRAYFTKPALDRITAPYRLLHEIIEMEMQLGKKWHMRYCTLTNTTTQ